MGLTEIQVYESGKKKIDIDASKVKVSGAKRECGELAALFNGKCKVSHLDNFQTQSTTVIEIPI